MDSEWKTTTSSLSEAHPETMDFLSNAWCDFAVQALQPELELQDRSIILLNDPITKLEPLDLKSAMTLQTTDTSVRMDNGSMKSSLPPSWKSSDVQSWIWMQQAMHPELNYNRKKWLDWKILPFKGVSIKKWLKEMKQKRKEEGRLKKAEVHAALSIAGLAASLAAIAAEGSSSNQYESTKDAAVASAAALVAAHCAKMAEVMGADKGQLRSVIGSAMTGTGASDVLTLTSAAATSLRGVEALQARTGGVSRLNGAPLPPPAIGQDSDLDVEYDFDKCRILLAKGAQLYVETSSGKFALRSVSILLRSDAKVILKTRRPNFLLKALERGKESIVLDVHTELYKDAEMTNKETEITCYLVVLTTTTGTVKLDMSDDYTLYKAWTMTINHMLKASTSCTKYDLEFYKI